MIPYIIALVSAGACYAAYLRKHELHIISSKAGGDANAQIVCSCGWESQSYSSGPFYSWEARWDMARAAAYLHLHDVKQLQAGTHQDEYRQGERI